MEIKAYGLKNHPDISSFFDDYGVDDSDALFDAFGNQADEIAGVKFVWFHPEDDPERVELHIGCNCDDLPTIKRTIVNFLNSELDESKADEASLSAKTQARQEVKKLSDLFDTFHGFKVWGPSFLDLYNGGKFDYPIAVPGDAAKTEEEAKALAAKRFDEFDDYTSWTVELVPEGGLNGEDMWFPCVAFKPSIMQLDYDDAKFVFGEIADAIDKAMGYEGKCEAISPKLAQRAKLKELDSYIKTLPNFQELGTTISELQSGFGYGVGNNTEKEQQEFVKDLEDFDEYFSHELKSENGEYYAEFKTKPAFLELSLEEAEKVLKLFNDALNPYI